MSQKALLVLIDGLRPDAVLQCQHPFLREFLTGSCTYTLEGRSVLPSLTLPCHMSLFHSVNPERHGVLCNTYSRPSRDIDGLFDVLTRDKKCCHFYYTWPELRDLCRPGSVSHEEMINYHHFFTKADHLMFERTAAALQGEQPDFIFYYTGHTDETGHKYGWMGPEYMDAVAMASEHLQQLMAILPEDYCVFVTADHGGHDRNHGTDMPEDMTIPIGAYGPMFEKGKVAERFRLIDIAPTIAKVLGTDAPYDWDGVSLI